MTTSIRPSEGDPAPSFLHLFNGATIHRTERRSTLYCATCQKTAWLIARSPEYGAPGVYELLLECATCSSLLLAIPYAQVIDRARGLTSCSHCEYALNNHPAT